MLSSRGAQRTPPVRIDPSVYRRVDLRAHALLEGVPIHDVWRIELAAGSEPRSLLDLRALLSEESLRETSWLVRLLFGVRAFLGRVFGWEREAADSQPPPESYLSRLSEADRASSAVAPGTLDGPFRVLYATPTESVSEIRNPTVHAFSVFALESRPSAYALYWAIYVMPVGRITRWYMALIDPFRRFIIYPAVLRRIRSRWAHSVGTSP